MQAAKRTAKAGGRGRAKKSAGGPAETARRQNTKKEPARRIRPSDEITERQYWEERLDIDGEVFGRYAGDPDRFDSGGDIDDFDELDHPELTPEEAKEKREAAEKKRQADMQAHLARKYRDAMMFLRNATNEKYGGHPEWQGETRTRAEHALHWIRLELPVR